MPSWNMFWHVSPGLFRDFFFRVHKEQCMYFVNGWLTPDMLEWFKKKWMNNFHCFLGMLWALLKDHFRWDLRDPWVPRMEPPLSLASLWMILNRPVEFAFYLCTQIPRPQVQSSLGKLTQFWRSHSTDRFFQPLSVDGLTGLRWFLKAWASIKGIVVYQGGCFLTCARLTWGFDPWHSKWSPDHLARSDSQAHPGVFGKVNGEYGFKLAREYIWAECHTHIYINIWNNIWMAIWKIQVLEPSIVLCKSSLSKCFCIISPLFLFLPFYWVQVTGFGEKCWKGE